MLRNLYLPTSYFLLDESDKGCTQMVFLRLFIRFNQQTVTQIFHLSPFPAATSLNPCVLHPFFYSIMMPEREQLLDYPQPEVDNLWMNG
jgi:hypothetical protein